MKQTPIGPTRRKVNLTISSIRNVEHEETGERCIRVWYDATDEDGHALPGGHFDVDTHATRQDVLDRLRAVPVHNPKVHELKGTSIEIEVDA